MGVAERDEGGHARQAKALHPRYRLHASSSRARARGARSGAPPPGSSAGGGRSPRCSRLARRVVGSSRILRGGWRSVARVGDCLRAGARRRADSRSRTPASSLVSMTPASTGKACPATTTADSGASRITLTSGRRLKRVRRAGIESATCRCRGRGLADSKLPGSTGGTCCRER